MKEISLRTFLLVPSLAGIGPGSHRSLVREVLGAPDDYSAGHSVDRAPIWKFSHVELHFDPRSDCVWSVFADDPLAFPALDAGLVHGMALSRAEAELSRRGYSCTHAGSELLDGARELRLASGVRLLFDTSVDEPGIAPKLHAFTYGPRQNA